MIGGSFGGIATQAPAASGLCTWPGYTLYQQYTAQMKQKHCANPKTKSDRFEGLQKRKSKRTTVSQSNSTPTMAPAKRRKPAAKTQANEATTTVQRSAYEDDRAQRVAGSATCAAPVRTPSRSPVRSLRHARCHAAALFTSHLRQSCTQIAPQFHSAFAGLTSVGQCVDALLRMPPEDRSAPGPRSEAGALRATAA